MRSLPAPASLLNDAHPWRACPRAAQAGLGWVAASLQTLLVVFAALSPATLHNFACLKEDEACLGELAKPRPDICGLAPGTWEWTRRCGSRH